MNRRELLTSAGAAGAALSLGQSLAPVKAIAAEAKPIRITGIETFNLELPATPTDVEAGVMNRIAVTRVVAESGVKGYSFGGPGGGGGGRGGAGGRGGPAPGSGGNPAGLQRMRDALIGSDLFAV